MSNNNNDAGSADLPQCHIGHQVEDELLDAGELAAFLKVRKKRVYELGIPCVRLSAKTIRWARNDVLRWVASRRAGR